MRLTLIALFLLLAQMAGAVPDSIYDYKVAGLNGNEIDFSAFKGKKILVFNAPWYASFDKQYAELNALYAKYKDKLVVVGMLANDFGIAPGAGKKATMYKKKDYKVGFPISTLGGVKGTSRTPLFIWLTEKKYNHLKDNEVKWDFQKYLIDENGKLVAIFDPKIRVTDAKVIAAIEK